MKTTRDSQDTLVFRVASITVAIMIIVSIIATGKIGKSISPISSASRTNSTAMAATGDLSVNSMPSYTSGDPTTNPPPPPRPQ